MAAESPFGSSFGDPRKYMGQSPLAEIGKAAKTLLTGYALKESGFTDYLNNLGKKPEQTVVQGAVPLPKEFDKYLAPTAPVAPAAAQPVPPTPQSVAPILPQSSQGDAQQGVVVTPIPNAPPANIGEQILDNKWDGYQAPVVGPTSLKNPTDFNPLAPDTSNQMAVSPDAYKNVPGYGSTEKALKAFLPFLMA